MKKRIFAVFLALCMVLTCSLAVSADTYTAKKTSVAVSVSAKGSYQNWDGVSNVAQFIDNNGRFCFAYDGTKYVTVVRVSAKYNLLKERVKLKKAHPEFGTVTCDSSGNFYLVTGETNESNDTNTETIFISKYDASGKHIATVGDNGSSSLAWYYDSSFYTKIPFDGGTCAAAINGNILSVNYAREMYSGHQSNSVFSINTETMEKVSYGAMYNSHSFAQRVIPFGDGFVYASEGDCYDRAFTIDYTGAPDNGSQNIFHFWVEKGALDRFDMWTINNNFAHMGGLAKMNDKLVALLGTSVKSLNANAEKENEGLFIQIFDPAADLSKASSYSTKGTRSGLSGANGDEQVTDYGVKWIVKADSKITISHPQIVSIGDDKAAILYERTYNGTYSGVYYCIVNSNGKVVSKSKRFSKTAKLNPCVMPVYRKGNIQWVGNSATDQKNIYLYSIKLS